MDKIIDLLTLSQSFSNKEKFLIYKIVKNNPQKKEEILKILQEEQEKIEKIKNDFLEKIWKDFIIFFQNIKKEQEKNILEKRNSFLQEMKKMEEIEKQKENLELEKIFL